MNVCGIELFQVFWPAQARTNTKYLFDRFKLEFTILYMYRKTKLKHL